MDYPKYRKLKVNPQAPDKFCCHCKKKNDKNNFFKNRARYDGLSVLCKKHHKEIAKKSILKLKEAIYVLLGDVCTRCGFWDKRALQIDHINGGGVRDHKGLSPFKFYEKVLKEGKVKFQILCANCNVIKKVENNENITSRISFSINLDS